MPISLSFLSCPPQVIKSGRLRRYLNMIVSAFSHLSVDIFSLPIPKFLKNSQLSKYDTISLMLLKNEQINRRVLPNVYPTTNPNKYCRTICWWELSIRFSVCYLVCFRIETRAENFVLFITIYNGSSPVKKNNENKFNDIDLYMSLDSNILSQISGLSDLTLYLQSESDSP